ncbi:MAG: hypothetical protein R3C19_24140 [Planctomycetaceae bacterium]
MVRLTISFDGRTFDAIERTARSEGCSVIAWAEKRLKDAVQGTAEWPDGYFETIAGFGESLIECPPEVEIPLDDVSLDS